MARILIVEDDAAQRMLYEVEISEMGYEVVLAKDGREAMEKFYRKKTGCSGAGFKIARNARVGNSA